jgi:hypothetical protein
MGKNMHLSQFYVIGFWILLFSIWSVKEMFISPIFFFFFFIMFISPISL